MNQVQRIKMVKAMEYIARCVNDEEVFEFWLIYGIPDGDIELGDLSVKPDDPEEFECYISDENFADLMDNFLSLMQRAYKSGGLYCSGVVSKPSP